MGIAGIPQPFNDAIKLFTKEIFSPLRRNKIIFVLRPVIAISLSLRIWVVIPNYGRMTQSLSIIIIYLILRINIYPLLVSGWSSNRNYALIGSMRGVAQRISYEIRFAFIILFFILYLPRLRFEYVIQSAVYFSKPLLCVPIAGIWLVSCIAETNRTPFDFAEGESELVSGFNIEYGSGGFAIIFIAEYARIYFISFLFWSFFISPSLRRISLSLGTTTIVILWIWLRTTLPRYRYDILIRIRWFSILPRSILILALPTTIIKI